MRKYGKVLLLGGLLLMVGCESEVSTPTPPAEELAVAIEVEEEVVDSYREDLVPLLLNLELALGDIGQLSLAVEVNEDLVYEQDWNKLLVSSLDDLDKAIGELRKLETVSEEDRGIGLVLNRALDEFQFVADNYHRGLVEMDYILLEDVILAVDLGGYYYTQIKDELALEEI